MKSKISKKTKRGLQSMAFFALSSLVLGMSFGTPAFAALDSLGPLDTTNKFPTTIIDTNGLSLGQCLDPFHCAAATADLPDPLSPASFPGNFWDETFWYTADSMMDFTVQTGPPLTAPTPASMILVMAIEGAYGGGAVLDGDQIMFSRIRFRADGLIPNAAYVVTHPYGTIDVTAGGDGSVFVSDDCGMGIPGLPGGFTRILDCPIGPFLRADQADPALDDAGVPVGPPPAGFIGSIGGDIHVTGSPFNTNFFRIEGPGLPAGNPLLGIPAGVSTRLFALSGQISNAPGLSNVILDKATYTRPLVGPAQAQVFASSLISSQLTVSSSGGAASPLATGQSVKMNQIVLPGDPLAVPPVPPTPTTDFFVNVDLTTTLAGGLSRAIIVSDTTLNPPLSALSTTLVDVVNITEASYNQATKILTINAASSDEVTPLILVALSVPAPGNILVGGTLTATLNSPPDRVTVQSSQGGIATANVVLVGPGTGNFLVPDHAAPVAIVGPNQTVFLDTRVDISSAASSGVIASYDWVQVAGPPIAISNASTADIHFFYPTPPVTVPPTPAPTYTFQVTVTGPGGVSSAIVSVDAVAVPPIVPTVVLADVKLGKDEWGVEGVVSPVVPGSLVTGIIVTDSFGTSVDILANSFEIPADIAPDGTWQWGSKDVPLTTGLAGGQWTIHAVSSSGTVGPSVAVNFN